MISFTLLAVSCGEPDFLKYKDDEISYQICPGISDIIRVEYPEDKGAPSLQLFDKDGKLLDNITINPIARFIITNINNSSIQITYFVASGQDFDFFIPLFKHNKYNPNRIGNYSINYKYEIENDYSEKQSYKIDSLEIDKQKRTVKLFTNKTLLVNLPIYSLNVNISGMTFYDTYTKTHVYYKFEKKVLFRDYLSKVINIYCSR